MPMTPTCRRDAPLSAATARANAACCVRPCARRSSSSWPYSVRVLACVATAPTPARTHGTPFPTHATRVVTATPTSPVAGSTAAIENVENPSGSRQLTDSCAFAGTSGNANSMTCPTHDDRRIRELLLLTAALVRYGCRVKPGLDEGPAEKPSLSP